MPLRKLPAHVLPSFGISCSLNQIPYDYIMEVRNRFKGLNLVDRVPEELWTEVWYDRGVLKLDCGNGCITG